MLWRLFCRDNEEGDDGKWGSLRIALGVESLRLQMALLTSKLRQRAALGGYTELTEHGKLRFAALLCQRGSIGAAVLCTDSGHSGRLPTT